ncbi:MAG: hypothetical protein ACRDV9_02865 [Acidimicrobiia bacterium]
MKDAFMCGVDRFGWVTCGPEYKISADNGGTIDVTLTRVPKSTHVKAIHCNGDGDIGHSRGWGHGEEGQKASVAVGVDQGACFKLVFSGDGPWEYNVEGFVEY